MNDDPRCPKCDGPMLEPHEIEGLKAGLADIAAGRVMPLHGGADLSDADLQGLIGKLNALSVCESGCEGRCRICPQDVVNEASRALTEYRALRQEHEDVTHSLGEFRLERDQLRSALIAAEASLAALRRQVVAALAIFDAWHQLWAIEHDASGGWLDVDQIERILRGSSASAASDAPVTPPESKDAQLPTTDEILKAWLRTQAQPPEGQ